MAGKKKTEAQEPQSLEENFSAVEELIGQLEAEDISLEEAFTAYSKGMNLLKQCSEQIDRVEKQVMKLNEEEGWHQTWKKRYSDRNCRRERQRLKNY